MYYSGIPPLVAGATTLPPHSSVAQYPVLTCRAVYEARLRGVLFCPLNRGKSGAARIGGASAASRSAECVSNYMTHKANPVTLTLIICGEAATTTLGLKGRQT